jgi:hypothetical protein
MKLFLNSTSVLHAYKDTKFHGHIKLQVEITILYISVIVLNILWNLTLQQFVFALYTQRLIRT